PDHPRPAVAGDSRVLKSPGFYGVIVVVKLALVVRADLGMGRGKIAAQVAHAAVAAVLASSGSRDFAAWLEEGQPKVVLKVASGEQLLAGARRADADGRPGRPRPGPGPPPGRAGPPARRAPRAAESP